MVCYEEVDKILFEPDGNLVETLQDNGYEGVERLVDECEEIALGVLVAEVGKKKQKGGIIPVVGKKQVKEQYLAARVEGSFATGVLGGAVGVLFGDSGAGSERRGGCFVDHPAWPPTQTKGNSFNRE